MKRLLLLATLLASASYAQTVNTPALQGASRGRVIEAKRLMPASLTTLTVANAAAGTDVQVYYLAITNPDATATTFRVQDADGASLALFSDVSLPARSTYIVPMPEGGLRFAGGVYIQSGSGAVVLRLKGWVAQ